MKVARNRLKVWNATTETLPHIDIGSWFAPELSRERTPTLRQALELAHGRAGVVIELKHYGRDKELESRVAKVVESTGMESNVIVMSLKRKGLTKFASLRPTWTRGLLSAASVGDLTRLNVDFLALTVSAQALALRVEVVHPGKGNGVSGVGVVQSPREGKAGRPLSTRASRAYSQIVNSA